MTTLAERVDLADDVAQVEALLVTAAGEDEELACQSAQVCGSELEVVVLTAGVEEELACQSDHAWLGSTL